MATNRTSSPGASGPQSARKATPNSSSKRAGTGAGAGPAGSPATPAPASSSRPASPQTSTTATPPPGPSAKDLSPFLNLPLKLTLAHDKSIQGSLWTYDPALSLVVLSSPSAVSPQKRSYTLIKTQQIVSVQVLSETPDPALPSLSDALKSLSVKDAEARVERAVQEDQRARARIGKGVTLEAQSLFDALGKTLPVRWHETQIIVMDEVLISAPYRPADVKGTKGSGERVERVRKVLEGERARLGLVST
ncbi:hypothetical protein T439DRAFT_326585 [Meredithblackwellia eburnea MCA 4105]